MTQTDLFDNFTRFGTSIVPPTADELARRRRSVGMARAEQHAERIEPDWQARAVRCVAIFARTHATFLTEDVRAAAGKWLLPLPADPRAWGPAMKRAERAGIVEADGYAPANSSNRSPKVRWRSLVVWSSHEPA